jgi:methylenetetrahydrofolate dehydrogenase (NADP+)/methenyltetrahydrofolate cyclohydrolase
MIFFRLANSGDIISPNSYALQAKFLVCAIMSYMTKIIDGKKIAEEIRDELRSEVLALAKKGIVPGLVVILVGEDSASQVYVRNKERVAKEIGINSQVVRMSAETSQEELEKIILQYNADKKIHGILVQLPLPKQINAKRIINDIIIILPDQNSSSILPSI